MLLALVKIFLRDYAPRSHQNYATWFLSKDRTGRIERKQGIRPLGTSVFYISKYPDLTWYQFPLLLDFFKKIVKSKMVGQMTSL